MKTVIRNLRWLSAALCAMLLAACAGSPPTDLGVRNGRLAPCPDSPNCVSSQADNETHRIAPLTYSGPPESLLRELTGILESNPGAEIVEAREGYVRAEFRSRILGFVDDAEFMWQSPGRTIEVRSASRLGYGDFGVNRERIEHLRSALTSGPQSVAN